jgi:SAM-dependent methyltransferase
VNIDLDRIKSIEATYADLDPMAAYYRKRSVQYETVGPLVPPTRPLLEQALRDQGHVLDIGCGDGGTLLDCAHLYQAGVGFDESHYILDQAQAEAKRRAISNVDFRWGKAIELPFADETFEFVWTERGPLGHNDPTLQEALRVLKPGGRIFIETGAEAGPDRTVLTDLETERDRFERHGLKLEILASRIREDWFGDIYGWFEYQCSLWRYFDRKPPFPYKLETLQSQLAHAGGDDKPFALTNHTIWIGGRK